VAYANQLLPARDFVNGADERVKAAREQADLRHARVRLLLSRVLCRARLRTLSKDKLPGVASQKTKGMLKLVRSIAPKVRVLHGQVEREVAFPSPETAAAGNAEIG
jgi:hypothetical protein